jgi:hypothetical protein
LASTPSWKSRDRISKLIDSILNQVSVDCRHRCVCVSNESSQRRPAREFKCGTNAEFNFFSIHHHWTIHLSDIIVNSLRLITHLWQKIPSST